MDHENRTKKRIREEALKLINQKDFDNVTLTDICKASGINKHTFYYYFKSKDELLKQYYKIPCHLTAFDLTSIFTKDSYVEQLWLLRKNLIEYFVNSGIMIVKQMLIKNLSDNVGTFEFSEEHERLRELQENMIEKGQSSGEILSRTEANILLVLLNQSMHSTIFMWGIKNGSFNLWDSIRCMFENILEVAPEHRKMQNYSPEWIL